MKLLKSLSLFSILVPAVAVAQVTQTAAGAHEFLRISTSSGGVSGYLDRGSGENRGRMSWYSCRRQMVFAGSEYMAPQYDDVCGNTQYGDWTAPAYKAIKYSPHNSCTGILKADAPYYESSFTQGNTHYSREPFPALNRWISWAKVTEVRRQNSEIIVREGSSTYRLILPGADIATRVAFAMEFLRTSCDPAAGTGF